MALTQCERIVNFITEHGSIKSELIKVKNSDGSYSRVGKYSFLKASEVSDVH